MTGRSILITGASSGIGRAAALGLRDDGWRVFATARRTDDLDRLATDGITAFHLDYADSDSIARTADAVLEATGGTLDALFNNGGYGLLGAVEDLSTDQLRAQFEANFFGWHSLTRRFIPVMRAQGHGRIVQCSSVLGYVSGRYRGGYAASKHALEALSDAMRIELADAGIHVVLIEPGPIITSFASRAGRKAESEIDITASRHRAEYEAHLATLDPDAPLSRFYRDPAVVLTALRRALTAPNPRPRYRVTVVAHGAALLRRLLPTRLLDRVLAAS